MIPKEGLAPGIKIGAADSAYHRVSHEWQDHLYTPQKVSENLDDLTVMALEIPLHFSQSTVFRVTICVTSILYSRFVG